MLGFLAFFVLLPAGPCRAFVAPAPPPKALKAGMVATAEDVRNLTSKQEDPVPADPEVAAVVARDFDGSTLPADDELYGWYSGRILAYDPDEKIYRVHAALAYGGVFGKAFKFVYIADWDASPGFWDRMREEDKKKMEEGMPALAEGFTTPDKGPGEALFSQPGDNLVAAIRRLGDDRLIVKIRDLSKIPQLRSGGKQGDDPVPSYLILAPNWKRPIP